MPFPDSPRVIYARNPLIEVLCQLRFPTILRIDSELPTAFQERIREAYPHFAENQLTELRVDLPPEVVQLSKGAIPPTLRAGKASYDFISANEQWKVVLNRDFLALSTVKYSRWEDFKAQLQGPLQAFTEIYFPAFFSRIGLRYRDVIRRSQLGLDEVPWAELLQPHIAGELASGEVASCITGVAKQIQLRLPDGAGEALMQHGFVQHQEGEICYLIDSDFSISENTEVSNAIQKLDSFNQTSRRLFRWCITERLHRAMEPRPI